MAIKNFASPLNPKIIARPIPPRPAKVTVAKVVKPDVEPEEPIKIAEPEPDTSKVTITKEVVAVEEIDVSEKIITSSKFFDEQDLSLAGQSDLNDGFLASNEPTGTTITHNTVSTTPKFKAIPTDGSFNDKNTIVKIIKPEKTIVKNDVVIDASTIMGAIAIMGDIGVTSDKAIVKTPSEETTIVKEDVYDTITDIANTTTPMTKFSFEYLSYLFFETDIDTNVPSFYSAINTIITNKDFEREEDYSEDALELDAETIQLIFSRIWGMAKLSNTSVKNLIGFYIYFNRRLKFLPILLRGVNINDFISNLTLTSVVDTLLSLGIYPVNNTNLFNRIWDSYMYSVNEDSNEAEIKLSLKEYYSHDINKSLNETYNGFTNKNDKLLLAYDLELASWSNKRSFNTHNKAFKIFKDITVDYIAANLDTKAYLINLLPTSNTIYMKTSLVCDSSNISAPHRDLWSTLQSFDTEFKINRLNINKNNINNLFLDFANSDDFPIEYIESNDYTALWLLWVNYINTKASEITTRLADADGTDHDYVNMFKDLVKLVNAKFILQYLTYNNSFQAEDYTDGTTIVDAAIAKVYDSLASLKEQIKSIIDYTIKKDRRFFSTHV